MPKMTTHLKTLSKALVHWFSRVLPGRALAPAPEPETQARAAVMPFDPHLLTRARTQWQFGDWQSLAQLAQDQHHLAHHPQRAELRILATAGALQTQPQPDAAAAKAQLKQSLEEGASREAVARMLIAGVHNSLAKGAALAGRPQAKVLQQFEQAQRVGLPGVPAELTTLPSAARQLGELKQTVRLEQLNLPDWPDAPPRAASAQSVTQLPSTASQPDVLPQGSKSQAGNPTPANAAAAPIRMALLLNQTTLHLDFTPGVLEAFALHNNQVSYRLAKGQPGYLVSNQSGKFNQAPMPAPFALQPDTAYEVSGHIANQGGDTPAVWLFEYANGKKIAGQSVKTQDGYFRALVRTHPGSQTAALGIRLSGEGVINLDDTRFQLRTNADIALAEAVQSQVGRLGQQIEETLSKKQKQHSDNQIAQIESFIRLQNYMGADVLIPDMHSWPVSPDLGLLLVRLFEGGKYDAVVEFGSGVSTLILAKAISNQADKRVGNHGAKAATTPFLSFDHLEQYHAQTADWLTQAGLADNVELNLAPLTPYQGPDGQTYSYYNCTGALQELRTRLAASQPRILVLVDGPPGSTGPKARYPALPVLIEALGPQAEFHVLMDDYFRQDEKDIVADWIRWLDEIHVKSANTIFKKLEKQACLLKVNSL